MISTTIKAEPYKHHDSETSGTFGSRKFLAFPHFLSWKLPHWNQFFDRVRDNQFLKGRGSTLLAVCLAFQPPGVLQRVCIDAPASFRWRWFIATCLSGELSIQTYSHPGEEPLAVICGSVSGSRTRQHVGMWSPGKNHQPSKHCDLYSTSPLSSFSSFQGYHFIPYLIVPRCWTSQWTSPWAMWKN